LTNFSSDFDKVCAFIQFHWIYILAQGIIRQLIFKKNALKFQSFKILLEQMEDLHHEVLGNV